MRFERFIGNPEYFEEDLAEAKAMSRVPKRDFGRDAVMRETGRNPIVETSARTAADVMAGMKALQEFSALKNTL